MEAIQVYKVQFDTLENHLSNALSEKVLGTFIDKKGEGTGYYRANVFIQNLEPMKLYVGWDHQVYPQIKIRTININ